MKSSNLLIEETKQELTSLINSKLKVLPIGVIRLLLENSLIEVNNLYEKIIKKEMSEHEEEMTQKTIQNETDSEEE